MANRDKKKTLTRKQHSRIEIENRQRKYILIGSIAIVVVVIITIVVGIIIEGIIKPKQPVARVGEISINTSEFQSYTRYQRFRLVNEYLSTYQFIQGMGDPNSASYFESYLMQIQSKLEPEILGLDVINLMIEDEIIRLEAERLGITVSKDEVDQRLQGAIFQYYPLGTPTPNPTSITLPSPTLSSIQKTLIPPTPTEVITSTEILDEENVIIDGVEESPGEESEIATPTLMPTNVVPTPTTYTENAYKKDYNDYIRYLNNYARIDEEDVAAFFEKQILRELVEEAVITDLPKEEEKLWARHILFRDEETGETQAQAFLDRINSGEDFIQVAEELSINSSEDEETGSSIVFEDLGWFGEGMMVEPFELAAKTLEIGEISEPVQTSFGWHIIQLLGRDVQPRSQSNIDQLRTQAFQVWLTQKRAEYEIDISQDWINLVPEEPDIPEQAKIQTEP
jgi:parvulin-like peptidyl-prolyl isomerase